MTLDNTTLMWYSYKNLRQGDVMTREIALTKGMVALVDDDLFDWLNQWNWYTSKTKTTMYAARDANIDGAWKTVFMHRIIMDAQKGLRVDHVNWNGLDNRSENLRICTHAQNIHNSRKSKNNTSGYRGVTWHKRFNKWQAQICVNKKRIFIGIYRDKIEAARAYDREAVKHFGEFASINGV